MLTIAGGIVLGFIGCLAVLGWILESADRAERQAIWRALEEQRLREERKLLDEAREQERERRIASLAQEIFERRNRPAARTPDLNDVLTGRDSKPSA